MSDQWFVYDGVQQKGPFTEAVITEMAANGSINEQTYLWTEGLSNWVHYRESAIYKAPPPQQPTPAIPETNPAVSQSPNPTVTPEFQTGSTLNQWQDSLPNSDSSTSLTGNQWPNSTATSAPQTNPVANQWQNPAAASLGQTNPAVNQWLNATASSAPQANPAANQGQKTTVAAEPPVIRIKTMPWLLVWFLMAITFGIYYPSWFLSRCRALNSLQSREKLKTGVFVYAVVAYSIAFIFFFTSGIFAGVNETTPNRDVAAMSDSIELLGQLLLIPAAITLLVQCFKVRRILRDHFNDHLGYNLSWSGVGIFFFHIIYLQYKINQLDYEPAVTSGWGNR